MGRERERMKRLARGVYGRFHETGSGSIQVSFIYRGARCKETMTGLDPGIKNHVRFASRTRDAILAAIARGTFNYLEYFPDSENARKFGFVVSKRTVRQVTTAWLEEVDRAYPHSTARAYRGACDRFILPAIGELRIRDVTVEHVRAMFRDADIALKTARNYAGPLRAIFQRALDDDDIDRNPLDRINVKSLIPKDRHRSAYDPDPFDENEIEKILDACRRYRPDWLNYWMVAFYTGIRTSEQYGLEWSDVDFAERLLWIRRAVVEGRGKAPKTESSVRAVYLTDRPLEALRRQLASEILQTVGDTKWRRKGSNPPPQPGQRPKPPPSPPPPANSTAPVTGLDGPEQRILDAIAWLDAIGVDTPEQPAVAFMAGYRYGGGGFNNPRGRLRSKGLVEYAGKGIRLTPEGRKLASFPDIDPTAEALQAAVLDRLKGPEQRILKPLLEVYPEPMEQDALAAAAGYTAGSGGFNNPRGRLRSLGLIDYPQPGYAVARDILFPG